MSIKFGPAGTGEKFKAEKHKSSLEVPQYLKNMGLNAFEYQCGRGVNIGEQKAKELGAEAAKQGIALSLHAPYYISMSGADPEKRLGSLNYIRQSAIAASAMGATRIVVHSGSVGKMSRAEALELAKDTLTRAMQMLDDEGLSHITVCPETMGKVNQLGDLGEVMELCKLDERLIPCIDFGHLNARDRGSIKTAEDYRAIIDCIENNLGAARAKVFHSHFSKIEYTEGGEKRHLTFADEIYGPDYEPLMEEVYRRNAQPTFICESAGTQDIDALGMKNYYDSLN